MPEEAEASHSEGIIKPGSLGQKDSDGSDFLPAKFTQQEPLTKSQKRTPFSTADEVLKPK